MNITPIGYTLTPSDIDAILLALPLVISYGADNVEQQQLNVMHCMSVNRKLSTGSKQITRDDFRMIYSAVTLAVAFLSGDCPERFEDVDDEVRSALVPHFFTFSKIRSHFDRFAEEHGL